MAAADFNGDGRPDVASVRTNGDVTVFRNDGAGQFSAKTFLPGDETRTLGPETEVLAGDFNGDGKQDLARYFPHRVYFGDGTVVSMPARRCRPTASRPPSPT